LKRTLTVEIDDAAQTVKVTDTEEGKPPQNYLLVGVAIMGADARNNELFIQMYGSSSDMAWAFGQAYRRSRTQEAGQALKNFFKQAVAHICMAIDPNAFKNEVGAGELLNKWEYQDQSKGSEWEGKKKWN
jgi:hypothetical protein